MNGITRAAAMGMDRRRLVGATALLAAAAELGIIHGAKAQARTAPTDGSLGPLRQIEAGPLSIGYVEADPAAGAAVVLLHGWPYDIHSYTEVAPILAAEGFRVVVPYLRGYGSTRFLADETPRNGQQAALASDVLALMDALGIESAIIAGCDWGARTANIVAALYPERCKAMVSVSGYLIGSQAANRQPLPPSAERS
jgi:pimeloyl-ACP methyl ester carboxylesterase